MDLTVLIIFISAIIILPGVIILQIFLSRKENKWLGLILPLITLCAAIFFTLVTPVLMIGMDMTVTEETVTESGGVIENVITYAPQPTPDIVSMIFTGIYLFALYNIPTAVLLLIYAACRTKRKKNAELAKMNIQDL